MLTGLAAEGEVGRMAQCPECETFSTDPLLPAWAATYQHTATCTYDPDDDGFEEVDV